MDKFWQHKQSDFAAAGVFFTLSLLLTLPALAIETRLFDGMNVWIKPIKFQISLAVYFLTLAYFARWADPALLRNKKFQLYTKIVVLVALFEIVWITGAAMFSVASHYSQDNLFMMGIYTAMGLFAVTLTTPCIVLGRSILKYADQRLDPAMRWMIGASLVLSFVLTIIAAGTLSSGTSHHIGTVQTGAQLPILGWSREVGDLRIAHFFGLHAMHVLPLLAIPALGMKTPINRKRVVMLISILYVAFVVFVFVQALFGMPLIPLSS